MKGSPLPQCLLILIAAKTRLKVFYEKDVCSFYFKHGPVGYLLQKCRDSGFENLLLVTDIDCLCLPDFFGPTIMVPANKLEGNLFSFVQAVNDKFITSNQIILVDASAPFVSSKTLIDLLMCSTDSEFSVIEGSHAALAVTRSRWDQLNGITEKFASSLLGFYDLLVNKHPSNSFVKHSVTGHSYEVCLNSISEIYHSIYQYQFGKNIELISEGLGITDPHHFDLRGTVTFEKNVHIGKYVSFVGKVHLGNNVTIGSHCIIEDSVIGENCDIRPFTMIVGSVIGKNSRAGPYARIRQASSIGPDSQIGNFVEIKSTVSGSNFRINHHSFFGDAQVGNNVTIGAGSVTCNFDGKMVNNSTIEDNVFVGSGVMLIAPIHIGGSAFIAAGSTVSKSVPANCLTIARTPQISKTAWQQPKSD